MTAPLASDRSSCSEARRRATGRAGGFTLVELIVVMVVIAIVSVVAVSSLASVPATRAAAAGRLMVRDLSYARERAVATGVRTWVVFSVNGSSYSVLGENPASPGRAGAIALSDPANTGRTYVQTLNTGEYAGVRILSATFDTGSEVGFDWLGKPLNTTQASLAANGAITLSNSVTVSVQVGTGLAVGP